MWHVLTAVTVAAVAYNAIKSVMRDIKQEINRANRPHDHG